MNEDSTVQRKREATLPFMSTHRILIGGGIILFLILLVLSLITVRAGLRAWERADRATTLVQTGLVFRMFAAESPGHMYPELSPIPGMLSIRNEQSTGRSVVPEYISDPSYLLDSEYWEKYHDAEDPQAIFDNINYYYLGYAIGNDNELDAFAEAYKTRVAEGLPFNEDLGVPPGRGNNGSDRIHRLAEGVEQHFITNDHDAAASMRARTRIPVLLERPHEPNQKDLYVLYLDGHVEREPYPGRWPATTRVMNVLHSLKAFSSERR